MSSLTQAPVYDRILDLPGNRLTSGSRAPQFAGEEERGMSTGVGLQLPQWGPAARSDGLMVLLQRRESGMIAKLAPSSFMRSFRQEFGVPAHQWILRLRIEKADALLSRGDDIASIALATGFSSQSHFTTTYRRIRGTTPGRSKRQL